MKDEYTLYEFTNVGRMTGEHQECLDYIKKNGGQLYTQVDCEQYTDKDGTTPSLRYVRGERLVNRTGWYGVA